MKKSILFVFLNLILTSLIIAQTTLVTEDFETDGEGSRYNSTAFDDCASTTSDYFLRTNVNPYSCANGSFGEALNSVQGSFFWVSEDIDGAVGNSGGSTATLELNTLNASGYSGITVSLYMAVGRAGIQTQWELDDKVLIQAKWGAGSFTTIGQFVGDAEFGGYLRLDNNLDGIADVGADFLTNTFTNYTFNVPGIGTNLTVRILLDGHDASEEFAFDQIVIQGSSTPPPNFAPILANIENSPFTYTEGDAATQVSHTITVTDPDDVDLESAVVQICSGLDTGEDVLDFTPVGGITGSYNPSTGVLELNGTSSVANYQTVLRSITYENTNTNNPSNTKREICFTVNDGTDNSNTQSRSVGIMDVISDAVCLPFAESFESDGEGVSYVSNTFDDSPSPEFFIRTNTQPPGHADAVTGVDGSYFWASEDIMGGSNGAVPGVIEFAPIIITGLDDFTFQLLAGISNDNGVRWDQNDNIKIQYNIDGGGWNTFGLFQGDDPFGGNLKVDTDNDPATPGPYGATVPNGSVSNFNFSFNGTAGDELRLRIVFEQAGGSEELVIDNIRFDGTVDASTILTAQPENQTVCPDNPAVFSVTTTDNNLDFQWQENSGGGFANLTDGGNISGANTSSLSLAAATAAMNGNQYRVIISSSDGCGFEVISDAAILNSADTEVPVITNCPENHEVAVDENCEYIIPDFRDDITVTDNCGIAQVTQSPEPGFVMSTNNPSVSTGVTITALDINGNSSTCTFGLSAVDNIPPVISNKPSDQILSNAPGECSQSISWAGPTVTDNCCFNYSDIVITTDPVVNVEMPDGPAGYAHATFPVGTTTIYYTVPDCEGNEDEFSFIVTVNDTEPPTLECVSTYNVNLEADGTINLLAGVGDALSFLTDEFFMTFEDNCAIADAVSHNHPNGLNFDCDDLGYNNVRFYVQDINGNTAFCDVNIIVSDPLSACNQPPVAVCQNITIPVDANCQVTITATDVDGGSSDPDGDPLTLSLDNSGPFGLGTHIVELTVNDGLLEDKCTATITVIDVTSPAAPTPPADLTVQCIDDVPPPISLTATDNCGDITVNPITQITPGGCANNFTEVRTWTFTDVAGNSVSISQKITVNDDTAPLISGCPISDIQIPFTDAGKCYYTAAAAEFDISATDNCSGTISLSYELTGATIATGSTTLSGVQFNYGTTTVIWTATDDCGNSSTCTFVVNVNNVQAVTMVTVNPTSQQYSDMVEFEATIEPWNCLNAQSGDVVFYVGTQAMGVPVPVGSDGKATASYPLAEIPTNPSNGQMSPGVKTVRAEFINTDPAYSVTNPTTELTITQENTNIKYAGVEFQATEGSNSSEATVELRAVLQSVPDGAGLGGDIRNACVYFEIGSTTVGPLTPELINPADLTTGVVVLTHDFDIGNADFESYDVKVITDCYFVGSDQTVLTVYKPVGDFITGGGHIKPTNSAGIYAATPGLKTNFGFHVKFNKKGKNLQGGMNIIFRQTVGNEVQLFQIKTNAMNSLGINIADPDALVAEFVSKANMKNLTTGEGLGGNLTLQVKIIDRGEPGENDEIAITLWDRNTLLYSSEWTGLSTDLQYLVGGNTVVHAGFSLKVAEIATDVGYIDIEDNLGGNFTVDLYPNPSKGEVTLKLHSSKIMDSEVIVRSITGSEIFRKKYMAADLIKLDLSNQVSGTYIILLKQGDQFEKKKLILDRK